MSYLWRSSLIPSLSAHNECLLSVNVRLSDRRFMREEWQKNRHIGSVRTKDLQYTQHKWPRLPLIPQGFAVELTQVSRWQPCGSSWKDANRALTSPVATMTWINENLHSCANRAHTHTHRVVHMHINYLDTRSLCGDTGTSVKSSPVMKQSSLYMRRVWFLSVSRCSICSIFSARCNVIGTH